MSGLSLDIRPNNCPNPFNPTSNGNIPISLLGSGGFAVNTVVPSSLSMKRSDGIGGSVPVIASSWSLQDKATPYVFFGWCGCAFLGLDTVVDLNIRFSNSAMAADLDLIHAPGGSFVELVVQGQYQNGAAFSATDCVWIVPPTNYDDYYFPEDFEPLP